MFLIRTERLILRDFISSDLISFSALRQDDKFLRFYNEEDSADSKAGQLLTRFIQQTAESPRMNYQLAIVLNTGELIGTCGIRAGKISGEYSIGCELGRLWHGKGFAQEAGKAIIDFGLSQLGAHKVYAETVSENKAAIRLCRQLGMKIEEECKEDRYFKGRKWGTTVLALYQNTGYS